MKKFLACSLIAMLACGALLAGCGGDKKDEAAAGKTKACFCLCKFRQRRRLFHGA